MRKRERERGEKAELNRAHTPKQSELWEMEMEMEMDVVVGGRVIQEQEQGAQAAYLVPLDPRRSTCGSPPVL